MRRRDLLAALPASLSLSGCIDDSSGDGLPTEQSPVDGTATTGDDTGTAVHTSDGSTTEADAEVTVHDVTLQYGLVWLEIDTITVREPGTPFVVADVAVDGALPRDAFELRVDDAAVPPRAPDVLRIRQRDRDDWYDGSGRGLLLFDLSQAGLDGESTELRLTWPGDEHALDDGLAGRLARGPPSFDATLDTPAEVPADEADGEHEVTVEVTNGGDGPARFLGALNRRGPRVAYMPVQRLTALVDAGETVSLSVRDEWSGPPPEDGDSASDLDRVPEDVVYELDWTGGETRAGIEVI